jgi:histidinol-phosphate aminotransferase
MGSDRLSRRDLFGGVVSAAVLGAIARRVSAAPTIDGPIRRTDAVLRLGANENGAGLGPAARAALVAAIDEGNRYGGRGWGGLVDALTAHHRVGPSWIHVTPGSGTLLRTATLAFTGPNRPLVVASPTFEAPARTARETGATVVAVPVTADGRHDLDAMLAKAAGAGLVYVCNPNNPTGGTVPGAALGDFVKRLREVAPDAKILIDEAYHEYADDTDAGAPKPASGVAGEGGYTTAVPLAAADPRVIVTRTFSKVFGMAGLRVGYAIAHPDTLAPFEARAADNAMSNVSLAAATAAFADTAHLAAEQARNRTLRQAARERFEAKGYRVLPSAANFLMVDIKRDAGSFGWTCRQHRIAVARPFPPLSTCMRLTIGTAAEMDEAVPAILALLEAPPSARAGVTPVWWVPGREC